MRRYEKGTAASYAKKGCSGKYANKDGEGCVVQWARIAYTITQLNALNIRGWEAEGSDRTLNEEKTGKSREKLHVEGFSLFFIHISKIWTFNLDTHIKITKKC